MRDAYIVTSVRTPGCKRAKGALAHTRPEDLLAFILGAAVKKTAGLKKEDVDDLMIGCAFPEAEQGLNIGRIVSQMAGFPDAVSGATINRFCASGLEAIAQAAMRVMVGWADVAIGGGVESMSYIPLGGYMPRPHPQWSNEHADLYIAMGITAENVARAYGVSREDQDVFALQSHQRAAEASRGGKFTEIVPTPAVTYTQNAQGLGEQETQVQDFDDGIREDTTLEGLSKLRPVFAVQGSVTAGNSSQMTDGAAATVVMSEAMVEKLDLKPIARLRSYTTVGCRPDEMGVGPLYAIPKLLKQAGLSIEDVGLFEINEAFAAQALYCIRELGLEGRMDQVNVNGGAIALGHPLGCTGAKLCATLLANMQARGVQYGVESMCVGGGMGAAALFELC
jgi:acetyl-CoA acyltransferase